MTKPLVDLTREQEEHIAAEYVDGASPKELQALYGLTKPRFYRLLRRCGVDPDGRNSWLHVEKHPRCVVCGTPIGGWGRPVPNGKARYRLTCPDPDCQVLVQHDPTIIPAHRWIAYVEASTPPGRTSREVERLSVQLSRRKQRAVTAVGGLPRFLVSPELAMIMDMVIPGVEMPWLKNYALAEDRRGDARKAAHSSEWSEFSRKKVFARLISSRDEETAIFLRTRPGQNPVEVLTEKYLGPETHKLLEYFDLFLAWNCSCPHVQRYTLGELGDFPRLPGVYGLCPRCGSAAIEIVEMASAK